MPGKPYTMNEMKRIVDFLVENGLYGEIRGRKMWMDLAGANNIERTWQSMKETFLKRILPDIHNPYYKLTIKQISSFRQEMDLEKNDKPKLNIRRGSRTSSTANSIKDNEQPSTSKNPNDDHQSSGIVQDRSSTETVVIDNCYDNAEQIQRELESPNPQGKSSPKSMRDFIIYSEPLTPQMVLQDFATDEEDELQMQIVEDVITHETTDNPSKSKKSPWRLDNLQIKPTKGELQNKTEVTKENSDQAKENAEDQDAAITQPKTRSLKLNKDKKDTLRKTETNGKEKTNVQDNESKIRVNKDSGDLSLITLQKNSQINDFGKTQDILENCSSNTTDTVIPNNQEALRPDSVNDKVESNEGSTLEFQDTEAKINSGKKKGTKKGSGGDKVHKKILKKTKSQKPNVPVTRNGVKLVEAKIVILEPNASEPLFNSEVIEKENKNKDEPKETKQLIDVGRPNEIIENTSENVNNEGLSQISGPSSKDDNEIIASQINPCLQSVNLFAQRFSKTKYSSESDNEGASKFADKDVDNIKETIQTNNSDTKKTFDKSPKYTKDDDIPDTNKCALDNQNEDMNHTSDKTKIEETSKNTIALGIPDTSTSSEIAVKGPIKEHPPKIIEDVNVNIKEAIDLSSESDRAIFNERKKKINESNMVNDRERIVKDRTLANVFGFSSGTVARKRTSSYLARKKPKRHFYHHELAVSESSDRMSTESDSNNFSPNKQYKRPEALDVVVQDKNLFALCNKSMCPITRHRKGRLCHVSNPDDEYDEEEHYWKLKYFDEAKKLSEEKIRADELARKLKQLQDIKQRQLDREEVDLQVARISDPRPSTSSAVENMQAPFLKNIESANRQSMSSDRDDKKTPTTDIDSGKGNSTTSTVREEKKEEDSGRTFKVRFMKDQIELECSASINPDIIQKMAQVIQQAESNGRNEQSNTENVAKRTSSGNAARDVTPQSDPEVKDKVDKLESAIFKEIEDKDETAQRTVEKQGDNVNIRKRGRKKKLFTDKATKVMKIEDDSSNGSTAENKFVTRRVTMRKEKVEVKPSPVSKRTSNKPQKNSRTPDLTVGTPVTARQSKSKQSPVDEVTIPEEDSDVRYMFPKETYSKPKPTAKYKTRKSNRRYSPILARKAATPNTSSSIDSTVGYQDSNPSPIINCHKRKRRLSTPAFLIKRNCYLCKRRKSEPYLADNDTFDNSSVKRSRSVKSLPEANSTVDTAICESESYQLMMPKFKSTVGHLEKIEENATVSFASGTRFKPLSPLIINVCNNGALKSNTISPSSESRELNSSSISLPMSPELSIVENISIDKETVNNGENYSPTINETQAVEMNNQDSVSINSNKYTMMDVDISIPLMQQECGVRKRRRTVSTDKNGTTISDSILVKVGSVNIKEQTVSESLDLRLRGLMLESAKKLTQVQTKGLIETTDTMEVDFVAKENINQIKQEIIKKKRRSSTPRKKKDIKKHILKAPSAEAIVEETRTESCTFSGQIPSINIADVDAPNSSNIEQKGTKKAKTIRKKKDILKVKITRPRSKSLSKTKLSITRQSSVDKTSVCSDSGINEGDRSVELIHNHSETCLNTNECLDDSLIFVENNESVISVNSNSKLLTEDSIEGEQEWANDGIPPGSFCNDAQDATSLSVPKPPDLDTTDGWTQDIAQNDAICTSPPLDDTLNSLLTEDLTSDGTPPESDPRRIGWHLFSEDDTDTKVMDADGPSFGSNLEKIFPVTNAVPNLSTITEASREACSRNSPFRIYHENASVSQTFN